MNPILTVALLVSSIDALVLDQEKPTGSDQKVDQLACEAQFAHLSDEMRDLLDHPEVMCLDPLQFKTSVKQGIIYPSKHVQVDKDPILDRTHVLVVGSESSGSHFAMHTVASSSFGISELKGDFVKFDKVNFLHMSLPEGMTCTNPTHQAVPVLDDIGCRRTIDNECDLGWAIRENGRFDLNVVSTVQKYRERGQPVKVIQAIRDPEIAKLANLKDHCKNESLELEDNEMSFKLLLEAKELPEVTMICYEQVVEEGKPYIAKQLKKAGFTANLDNLPDIKNGNTNYQYSITSRTCNFAAKAYMQLCPDSPHTKELKNIGCMP